MVTNKNYYNAVFKSGIVWALCITLIEIVQITTSSSVKFLKAFDVFSITAGLFISYSILWLCFLFIVAIILNTFKKNEIRLKENISLFYWCVAFFSYEIFCILYKVKAEKLYDSGYGFLYSLILVTFAFLIAYAIYQIAVKLIRKGQLKQIGHKVIAFGISLIAYLATCVYLKSRTQDGNLSLLYSVLLLLLFLVISGLILIVITKIVSTFTRTNLALSDKKTKSVNSLIIFLVFVSFLFLIVFPSLAKNDNGVSQKPNVIFISIDTLRADHVSIYNEIKNETTPNIDRIAKDGYTFTKSYSTTSWTLPSHASMFTGLFPSSHGADRSPNQTAGHPVDPLAQSNRTLAEVLDKNGYLTSGFISVPYLSSSFGMDQGFQYYDEKIDLFENIGFLHLNESSMLFNLMKIFKIIDKHDYDGDRAAPEINQNALKWLEKNKNGKNPFFLFLHYFEPHYIYNPPEPYNQSEDGRKLKYFTQIDMLNKGEFSLSSHGLNDLITLYDGEISYLDHHLGLLFEQLNRWNLLDKTLLIITSDHGESFNEHEVWTHGNRLYEEQIRVPLIIHYPKLVPAGHVDREHIVQNVDLMPSILDILEISIPENIQGRSFLPLLNGKNDKTFNLAFAELAADNYWKSTNPRFGIGIKAVIDKEWKYIAYDNGEEELFNLDADPKEKMNLASIQIEKAKEMKKILDLWSNTVSRQKDEKNELIDSGRLEQLRSLGYVK